MIRGVAVVFGLVAIAVLVCAGTVAVVRTVDWWQRRRAVQRLMRPPSNRATRAHPHPPGGAGDA